MEKENQQTVTSNKEGYFAIAGVFLIGYLIGASTGSKRFTEGYSKGVADTLSSIIFKSEK